MNESNVAVNSDLSPALRHLENFPQFIVYHLTASADRPGKLDKIPVHHATGAKLEWTTPANWMSYPAALQAANVASLKWGGDYRVGFNGAAAARRAGYAEASAKEIACELLTFPHIKAAIERRLSQVAAVAEVDAALVVKELYDVATADPRKLMSVTVDCCRYCYGIDNRYQWTPAQYKREMNKAMADDKLPPDLEGGINFDPRRPPVESCPECHGRGVERVTVTPSAKLSRAAARLLASMKQTKDGIEIKTRDQDAALIAMGRVLGVFKDRSEMTGPGGGPMQLQAVAVQALTTLTNEELEAHLLRQGIKLPQPVLEATNER